jgi:hypothetical protein
LINNNKVIITLPVTMGMTITQSMEIGEQHRLMVFEDRVLRRIFGPKMDEVTGELKNLHNGIFIFCINSQI